MPAFTVQIKNEKHLINTMNRLRDRIANVGIRKALRAGAKPMLAAARRNAPRAAVGSKRGYRNIVLREAKAGPKEIVMEVGPTRKAFYLHFHEWGYTLVLRNGERIPMPARHWLRSAFDTEKATAVRIVAESLGRDIRIEAPTAGRGASGITLRAAV